MPRLNIRAAVDASSFNESDGTFEVVWSTGAKGLRRDFWTGERFYESLSLDPAHVRMDRLNNGAPYLAAHAAYSLSNVIGVVERAWLNDSQGHAKIRLSKREAVQPIKQDIQDGILRNVSVGYDVHTYERIRSEQKDEPDEYRAIDWEPMEISSVPMGFDDGAKVRSAEAEPMHQVTIIHRGTAAIGDREMPKENTVSVAELAPDQQAVDAARAAGAVAERARCTEIRSSVQKAGLGSDLADKLINDGVAIDAARAQIIDAMATKQQAEQTTTRGQHAVEVGQDAREKWVEGARNWLFNKAAVRHVFGDAGAKMEAGEFRGLSLVDLARDSLERAGVRTRGLSKLDLVGQALTHRSAYNGTSDFSVLLETAIHKILLGAYANTPDTWRRFCHIGSVSDFRAHNRYRLGSFGTLDALNEHGEFKQKQIPDGAKESITASTKGNIIGLTRQAIINDDMGAFNSLAAAFGRSAKLSIEVDVYTSLALNSGAGPALADGHPIFYNRGTGKNNITTSAALTADNLDLDRQAMASLTDISGNEYLDLRPSILLVSLALGSKGREINKMEYNEESSKQNKRPNSVRDLFQDIVDTPRITGNRRYLFADPNVAPVLEVAFLDGQQEPFLDNQNGWRVDGVEWKVRHDYGVAGVGYEGAITNAGG